MGMRGPFPGVRDHLPTPNAEYENEWSYTFVPQYVFTGFRSK